jgi:triphosphoribosyl-dephospho-CoA synthase
MVWPVTQTNAIADAVLDSCRWDVLAFKPGNVSIHSAGHGMSAEDFLLSAEMIAPIMAEPDLTVGERILQSVEITERRVGCNTNLGIILLCAPLVQAAMLPAPGKTLRERLSQVLAGLDQADARLAFQAIRLAAPGGLGKSEVHDVASEPTAGLLESMAAAQHRDRIAYQYVHDYEDIFSVGLPALRWADKPAVDQEAQVIFCYLRFLSTFPDSHIQRKFGEEKAEEVRRMAQVLETEYKACENLSVAAPLLHNFDKKLKQGGINPGTSADLTVASLLAHHLENLLADVSGLSAVSKSRLVH